MSMFSKTLTVLVLALPLVASADEPLKTGIGVSAIAGGGATGFTDKAMSQTITNNVGGLWDLRVTIGSHSPLAVDVGYVGTAAGINALTGTQQGTLIGSTAEGALRYNILSAEMVNPYVFAGIGYQRYDIRGANFSLSDTGMNASDNSVVFPMGAGVAFRYPNGVVADLHGTFRANSDYNLVLESMNSNSYVPMHSWEASAAIGYEF